VAQALLIVLATRTGWPIHPFGFEILAVDFFIGAIVNTRAIFTTFVLPKPTALANSRPPYSWDTVLAPGALAFALCAVVIAVSRLASHPIGWAGSSLVQRFCVTIVFLPSPAALLPIGGLAQRRPEPHSGVAIDIITPAFNEAEGIEATLASIEAPPLSMTARYMLWSVMTVRPTIPPRSPKQL
jgi:hypothetical protein